MKASWKDEFLIMMKVFLWFWALICTNITYCTFLYDTWRCVKVLNQKLFSFNHKTRLTVILIWVFSGMYQVWGSPGCYSNCDFELLKVFHVTKRHVAPPLLAVWSAAFQLCSFLWWTETGALLFTANSQNILRSWPWFCVSLKMCTGPVFRWRQYIPPLC